MPSVEPEIAADIAIAVQHADRQGLILALRAHPDAAGLSDEVIQATADMLMEEG